MSSTFQQQADQLQAASAGRLPADVLETFARDREALIDRGAGDSVKAGDVLENFTLPDATGSEVSLAEIIADGPAVLVFYRGGWCPYCNLALRHYQSELVPELHRHDARLVAITPQKPDASLSTVEKHGLEFPVLTDAGLRFAGRLGIAFEPSAETQAAQLKLGLDVSEGNAEGATRLPMPTVLVVDRDRVVRFADVHPDYATRTEAPAILAALTELESHSSHPGSA
ncbi:MAG TPA: peroxiredoxin-like family protein [Solirubrobacteraceae bacterium]|jgi:peroxiredoxin|nr:peroxiredoxin-like family protein [Solirubrobacteraceae bacterium]